MENLKETIKSIYNIDISNINFDWIRQSIPNDDDIYFLKYLIIRYSFRLCPNYNTIIPFDLQTYKETDVYKNTVDYIINKNERNLHSLNEDLIYDFMNSIDYDIDIEIIDSAFEYYIKNGVLTYISFDNNSTSFKNYSYFTNEHIDINIGPFYNFDIFTIEGQLIFLYNYIRNSVLYITGSTGSGKSTQCPKLIYFYHKITNNMLMPRIVCSEPRKNAVERNANKVSEEIGYPISENHYIVQIKHRDMKHVKNIPSIKYITDGSLFFEFFNSDYDIYIIDEAHEHNRYMDILLSVIRDNIVEKNNIKLIILSATLEQDELLYYKFFKGFKNKKFSISKPHHDKFKITDIFVPNMKYIDIILDIYKKKPGNILLFLDGIQSINEAYNKLKERLSNNILILKYHSNLYKDDKEYIENIDINNIDYDNFIIISTNIAEASITLKDLNYVIDNGYHKVCKYNYKLDEYTLITEKISEFNRIQRRGRVGRVADGTVYYTYENNLKKSHNNYGLLNDNLIDIIFHLLDIYDRSDLFNNKFYIVYPGMHKLSYIFRYFKLHRIDNYDNIEYSKDICFIINHLKKIINFDNFSQYILIIYAILFDVLEEVSNILTMIYDFDTTFLERFRLFYHIDDFFTYNEIMKNIKKNKKLFSYNFDIDERYLDELIYENNKLSYFDIHFLNHYNNCLINSNNCLYNDKIILNKHEKICYIFTMAYYQRIRYSESGFFINKMYSSKHVLNINNSIMYIPTKIMKLLDFGIIKIS